MKKIVLTLIFCATPCIAMEQQQQQQNTVTRDATTFSMNHLAEELHHHITQYHLSTHPLKKTILDTYVLMLTRSERRTDPRIQLFAGLLSPTAGAHATIAPHNNGNTLGITNTQPHQFNNHALTFGAPNGPFNIKAQSNALAVTDATTNAIVAQISLPLFPRTFNFDPKVKTITVQGQANNPNPNLLVYTINIPLIYEVNDFFSPKNIITIDEYGILNLIVRAFQRNRPVPLTTNEKLTFDTMMAPYPLLHNILENWIHYTTPTRTHKRTYEDDTISKENSVKHNEKK